MLKATGNYASYQWSDGETSQSITVKQSDTLSVTVTNSSGCSGTSSPEIVSVGDSLTPNIMGVPGFCQGEYDTLDAGAGYDSYQWSTNATTRTIVINTPGNYYVKVYKSGCSGTSQAFSVAEYPIPSPTINHNGPLAFCVGDSVILTAQGGVSYRWSNGDTSQRIVVKDSGSYSVTVANANDCDSTFAPVLTEITSPGNIAAPDILSSTICPNTATTIPVYIANNNTVTQVLTFTGTHCTLSQNGATVYPHTIDTLQATYTGGAVGVDTCIVTITGDCGGSWKSTLLITISQMPPLVLSLLAESDTIAINNIAKVFVIATPSSAVSGTMTFTIANEPTSLQFDSVYSPWGHASAANVTDSSATGNVASNGNSGNGYTGGSLLQYARRLDAFAGSKFIIGINDEHVRYGNSLGHGVAYAQSAGLRVGNSG